VNSPRWQEHQAFTEACERLKLSTAILSRPENQDIALAFFYLWRAGYMHGLSDATLVMDNAETGI